MKQIKNIFRSGLLILVPLVGTIWILDVVLNTIDSIFGPILLTYGIDSIYTRVAITILFVFLLGIVTKTGLGKWVVSLYNRLLNRVPVINKIFNLVKETTEMLIEKQSFSTPVRLKFGDISVIGFLTNESPNTVFLPTCPNITSGLIVFTDKYEILDMSVEDAMRQIISMGAISSKTYLGSDR